MDGCGRMKYRAENFDDHDRIFRLESEFREGRVRRASMLPVLFPPPPGLRFTIKYVDVKVVRTDGLEAFRSFRPI